MDDLIARLEAATGPDRELDVVIDMAQLNLRGDPATPVYYDGYDKGNWRDTVGLLRTSPAYTASIDAALTLVPEGWTRDVDATAPEMGIAVALHGPNEKRVVGDHENEPIATCIAALKARENKP